MSKEAQREATAGQAERSAAPASEHRTACPAEIGGNINIMPPQGSHSGGVDWVGASVYGYWPETVWPRVVKQLDQAREKAGTAATADGAWVETAEGDDILVLPHGVRHGVFCRWSLKWRGCKIDIVARAEEHATSPSLFVTIPSRVLMAVDWSSAWQDVIEFLQSLGFRPTRNVISRLDACVDMPGQNMKPFFDAFNAGRFVCRARKWSTHGEGPGSGSGVALGKGEISLRIYDKALEVRHDEEKRELLIAGRWQGEICDTAARVEFQLRRQVLKQLGAKTLDNLHITLPLVVAYCCEMWFRITAGDVDRENHNQQRAETDPLWEQVCQRFQQWTEYREPGRRQRQQITLEGRHLVRQALGCLASHLAQSNKVIRSTEDALQAIKEALADDMPDLVLWTHEKRRRWNVESGACLEPPSDVPF